MPRIPRIVVPGVPHHVTQRGTRRQNVFFGPEDYALYLDLLATQCRRYSVEVWGWCLMPNHAHIIPVPETADGLRLAIGGAAHRYSLLINEREKWSGHLWEDRFASFVMDERHTIAAARYVELNPVRAGLVERAEDWEWSSARAHLCGANDALVNVVPMLERVADWRTFLESGSRDFGNRIREHQIHGRPLGDEPFIDRIEELTGKTLRPLRRRTG